LESVRGIPQLFLDDIPDLPDEKLHQIIPVIADDVKLAYADGCVTAARKGQAQATELFPSSSRQTQILNCFDGSRSLGDISQALASQAAGPAERAEIARQVKDLFLRLVGAGVCRPLNPIE
jgi:hypothetical protein